jgi:hypothetical protein
MSFSILGAVKTCTLDTAWADKIQSDRFFNPNLMVCPTWQGVDNLGREVCPDSFYTKDAGCNSALDRVAIENEVSRPYYFEYIAQSAAGLRNDIYSANPESLNNGYPGNFATAEVNASTANLFATANGCNGSGGFGLWGSDVDGAVLSRCRTGYDENNGGCCKTANVCSANSPYQSMAISPSCVGGSGAIVQGPNGGTAYVYGNGNGQAMVYGNGGNAAIESFQNRQNQYANIAFNNNNYKKCAGF